MSKSGFRAVPSLRYLQHVPRFTRHYYVARGDELEDVGPGGGLMWDGRGGSLSEQALIPLLDEREMANRSINELASRLRSVASARRLLAIWGRTAFDDDVLLTQHAAQALAQFQKEDRSFHPYDSRYDAWLQGTEQLSVQELRGLKWYEDAGKGNCAECHPSRRGPGARPPDFTDFRFAALGVPRNAGLTVNADPTFNDLGLCGPLRTDPATVDAEYCGLFRTPTLRNVARRSSFFHNGRFNSLADVLHFYVERDSSAARWFSRVSGAVVRYDDLPPRLRVNVDRNDPPFDRASGERPALSEAEIEDLIAFLKTLDDRS